MNKIIASILLILFLVIACSNISFANTIIKDGVIYQKVGENEYMVVDNINDLDKQEDSNNTLFGFVIFIIIIAAAVITIAVFIYKFNTLRTETEIPDLKNEKLLKSSEHMKIKYGYMIMIVFEFFDVITILTKGAEHNKSTFIYLLPVVLVAVFAVICIFLIYMKKLKTYRLLALYLIVILFINAAILFFDPNDIFQYKYRYDFILNHETIDYSQHSLRYFVPHLFIIMIAFNLRGMKKMDEFLNDTEWFYDK